VMKGGVIYKNEAGPVDKLVADALISGFRGATEEKQILRVAQDDNFKSVAQNFKGVAQDGNFVDDRGGLRGTISMENSF